MIIIGLIFISFIILVLIPFIPGAAELVRPRDSKPLYIRMDYSKDPRYFGKTFKKILKDSLRGLREGTRKVRLSKDEEVEIVVSGNIAPNSEVLTVLHVLNDITSSENVGFKKEIYVAGDAVIGKENMVRAIASDGNIRLSEGAKVIRWLDAEGNIEVDKGCDLGISASSGNELRIERNCRFKRLFGTPVITFGLPKKKTIPAGSVEITTAKKIVTDKKRVVIPPATRVEDTLILKQELEVKEDCVLMGSLKVYGNVLIGQGVIIFGNIFSEGDIEIGEDSEVAGIIFSQKHIKIKDGVKIGNASTVKSVIGKKGIILGKNVTIYGYIMTESTGITT
ncbi:MAG: hypothetical protein HZC10_01495 [Nitrospirae bacterium]|nr:hypothetical protein [Nitrospirota bacterium]